MTSGEQLYIEQKVAERGLRVTISSSNNIEAEIVTLTDGRKTYQFAVTFMEMLQNRGEQMNHLLDYRIKDALRKPRLPRFDSVNPPISELAQRGV